MALPLPIDEVLGDLLAALGGPGRALLIAPPIAGRQPVERSVVGALPPELQRIRMR